MGDIDVQNGSVQDRVCQVMKYNLLEKKWLGGRVWGASPSGKSKPNDTVQKVVRRDEIRDKYGFPL